MLGFPTKSYKALLLVAVPLTLAACGGGGGGGGGLTSTPPPPPPPPTFTPPSGPLLDAVQTGGIAQPMANGPTPKFGALGQATDFPLLQTAVDWTFGGDVATTQAGVVLRANADGSYAMTVNGVSILNNVQVNPGSTQIGFHYFVADVQAASLDYTRFGEWYLYQPSEGLENGGAFVGGFLAPTGAIPTNGTATYSGTARGLYNAGAVCGCGDLFGTMAGNVSLTADFAGLSLIGSLTGVTITATGQTPGPMNDFAFNAAIDRVGNFFTGTTTPTTFPAGSWAFSNASTGMLRGRFYGPTAQELGAIFSVSDGSKRLIGSFGAKKN